MERRALPTKINLEARAENTPPVISGHAAVFYDGTAGTEFELYRGTYERVMPGAFDKALSENHDVRALFNHNPSLLLGRVRAGTLKLSVDSRGLKYEITPPDTQLGRDTVEMIRRGDLDGSSFGFEITDDNWIKRDGKRIREVRGVKLFDVSVVTFPAYVAADVKVRMERDDIQRRSIWARAGLLLLGM